MPTPASTSTFDAAIFGLIVADLIAQPIDLAKPPPPGGLQLINSISLTTGGNVCNTGVAMAKLGMNVAAAGLVGKDILAAAILDRLQQAGLDTSAVYASGRAQTSATIVAVEPKGERCFFHTPGVTPLLNADAFRRCFPIFKRSAIVQVGYFGLLPTLTPSLPTVLAELRQQSPQTRIAFDTVNPPADPALLWPILPHVNIFCPSRAEATAITGQTDPRAMAKVFLSHMPPDSIVAIKLDADGCYIEQNSAGQFIPAYPITVVDTTGAGDTWFGALLTALLHKMPLPQAAHFANRAAADCCTALGAGAGVQSFTQTLARL